jgi:hypothetical protein
MAKWEINSPPEIVPLAVGHYELILDELADLLYSHICKLEKTPSDRSCDKTQSTPRLVNN